MNGARLIGFSLALGLHGGLLYALMAHPGPHAFADGSGPDNLTVVAEVSFESGDFITQRAQEASVESNPAQAVPPAAPEKQEPEAEPQKNTEAELPLPKQTAEPAPQSSEPPRQEPPTTTQTASLATKAQDEQQAAAALAARRNKLWSQYLVEFSTGLARHKVHVAESGDVLLQITIAPSGQLLDRAVIQSSGTPALDRAAIAALERSAPFPPLPRELNSSQLTFTVPFHFRTR